MNLTLFERGRVRAATESGDDLRQRQRVLFERGSQLLRNQNCGFLTTWVRAFDGSSKKIAQHEKGHEDSNGNFAHIPEIRKQDV